MSGVQPITLNTTIGASQQTLMESPIFKSLFRDLSNKTIQTTQTGATQTTTTTTQELLPAALSNVTLFTLAKGPRFTAQQIALLIYKINPQGITLASLRTYPTSSLTPLQQQIRNYLISSPIVFTAIAKLDKNNATLSNQDIQIAAKIVQNINKTTVEPQQTPRQIITPPPQTPEPYQQPTNTNLNQPTQALTPLANQAVPPAQVPNRVFVPNALPIAPPQQPFVPPTKDLSKNENVRAFTSYAVMQARRKKRGDDLQPTDVTEPLFIDDLETTEVTPPSLSYVKPFFVYTEKIELDASEVKELFEKIAGEKKKLTLFNLRNYEPQNAKEEKILSVLKHLNVYQELSHVNHHDDLELEDIEIATHGKDFIFSDGRLDLIIHASKK